jgi:hypothetical protein
MLRVSRNPQRKDITMPIGSFLDSFPAALFITAHVAFLALGVWAWRRASGTRKDFASAFWLYVASQPVFLAFFSGAITMKMAVLVEQMLIATMVLLIALRRPVAA